MLKEKSPKEKLLKASLKPKKSFGQNFMMDQAINDIFCQAVSSLGPNRTCVEVGAGTGSLTHHLLKISPRVYAVERDRDLVPILKEDFKEAISNNQLVVLEADAARLDLSQYLSVTDKGILLGNLPYHLTSTIVLLAIGQRQFLSGCVFLLQKEVADRLLAKPHNKDYGFLTVILNLAFDISKVHRVNREAFWPVPRVDSTIIKFTTKESSIKNDDLKGIINFVRSIFQKRRKKLSTILSKQINNQEMISLGINPDHRPENLSAEQFYNLYCFIEKMSCPKDQK